MKNAALYSFQFQGETMGTTYTVQISETPSESDRLVIARVIEDTLESINSKMSNYREDSELSRLNRASAGEPSRMHGPPSLIPETCFNAEAEITRPVDRVATARKPHKPGIEHSAVQINLR